MSHQDGLGNNRTESTGLEQPDADNNRMQKKSENVTHVQDGIKLNKFKDSRRLRNSPTTPVQTPFAFACLKSVPALCAPRAKFIFILPLIGLARNSFYAASKSSP
jgi:hypothetical protein